MTEVFYTIAPASEGKEEEMLLAGATGVRQTFSFGSLEFQSERAETVRSAAKQLNRQVLILADLPGEKPRLGSFSYCGEPSFRVETGESIALLQGDDLILSDKALCINHTDLYESIQVGHELIVGDGTVSFTVVAGAAGMEAIAENAGTVENNRGVTLVGSSFVPKALTEYDEAAIAHIAADPNFDAVAVSFVSSKADIDRARELLGTAQKTLIAKIETSGGVENIAQIASVADQIMIARGDLALTMPWQELPAAVDRIVVACERAKTPFLIATQVAETMATQPMMSRAEMCDIWQWQQRGAAALILCRETGWGERPVETVRAVKSLLDSAQ